MPEKVITAFQSVQDEHVNEDTALNKCKAAVRRVGKMEKDVEDACIHGKTKPLRYLIFLQYVDKMKLAMLQLTFG